MNAIAKRESTTATADGWDDTAAEGEARLIRGSLLKFADAVPVVELGAALMSTRYGKKSKPTLRVVSWRSTDAGALPPPTGALPPPTGAQEMNDEIPW